MESNLHMNLETPRRSAPSLRRLIWREFCRHKLALFGLCVIASFCGVALFADVIAWGLDLDPTSQSILNRYDGWSAEHWLGTDEAGRDVLIRLVYGARISLLVGFAVAGTAAAVGVTVGAVAGYCGGVIDAVLMRLADSLLALPILPVLILFASLDFSKLPLIGDFFGAGAASTTKMIVVLMAFSWMVQARLIRGEILTLKNQDYVLAAKSTGMGHAGIIFKELLPNAAGPVIVSVTLTVGQAMLAEAALSFLGLGIQPPTPSWGNMLHNAQDVIYNAPSQAVLPGLLILIVVMAFNFVGDGLQDALDPRAVQR